MKLDDAFDFFSIIAGAVHAFDAKHPITGEERLFLGNLIRDVAWASRELPSEKVASKVTFELWYMREFEVNRLKNPEVFVLVADSALPQYADINVQAAWRVWQAARTGLR